MNKEISINKIVKPLVEKLVEHANELNLGLSKSEGGANIIDAGINNHGCLESGRLITEICMGGLGRVSLSMVNSFENWPLSAMIVMPQTRATTVNNKGELSMRNPIETAQNPEVTIKAAVV